MAKHTAKTAARAEEEPDRSQAADVDELYEYHALRDFCVVDGVEKVLVEWHGGELTWEFRALFSSPDSSDELAMLATWHYGGRQGPWADFRRAMYGRVTYTEMCGFTFLQQAFQLLGYPWITTERIEAYIASGQNKGKDYRRGMTWEQVVGFIKFVNSRIGAASPARPDVDVILKNRRTGSQVRREGIKALTDGIDLYLVGFVRAHVGDFVLVRTEANMTRMVYDASGVRPLDEHDWMDKGSQLIRVHKMAIKVKNAGA